MEMSTKHIESSDFVINVNSKTSYEYQAGPGMFSEMGTVIHPFFFQCLHFRHVA